MNRLLTKRALAALLGALAAGSAACGGTGGDALFGATGGSGGAATTRATTASNATAASTGSASVTATSGGPGSASTVTASTSGAAGTTGSGASSAASTGSGSGTSGGSVAGHVACNGANCSPGQVCCFNPVGTGDHCGNAGQCPLGYLELSCSNPSDCPGQGQVCCAQFGTLNAQTVVYTTVSCQDMSTCDDPSASYVVCTGAPDVCPPDTMCMPSARLGEGYEVCHP